MKFKLRKFQGGFSKNILQMDLEFMQNVFYGIVLMNSCERLGFDGTTHPRQMQSLKSTIQIE